MNITFEETQFDEAGKPTCVVCCADGLSVGRLWLKRGGWQPDSQLYRYCISDPGRETLAGTKDAVREFLYVPILTGRKAVRN